MNKNVNLRKKVSTQYREFDEAYHVTDLGSDDCSYGFYYTKNASPYTLNLMFRTEATEATGFVPVLKKENWELPLQSGEDHVIVFRQIKWTGRVCISCHDSVALAPELTDEQLLEEARKNGEAHNFEGSDATYKLHKTPTVYTLLCENPEGGRQVDAKFTLTLENMKLDDGKTDF